MADKYSSERGEAGSPGDRAVVYVRISDDPSGSERGVDRQEADCRELAQASGWAVVAVFRENDTSAFKQRTVTLPSGERVRRVVRPRFREMLSLLASGGADVMVAYDLDRAVRDPRDLEDLIDARVLSGFKVRSVTGSLRLDTDSDVAMARVLVAMANKSSADTARQVKRAARQQAVEGRWHGRPVPFGYRLADSRLLVEPVEAALVVAAVDAITGGESVYSVAKGWNQAGVRTSKGCLWTEKTLKTLLRNPVLKGVRSYRPVQPDGTRLAVPELTAPGGWDPIVGEDAWEKVNAVLDEHYEARKAKTAPPKRVHLFSGLIRCSKCGVAMRRRGPVYVCWHPMPGVCARTINAAQVSSLVEEAVLSVFSRIALGPKAAQAVSGGAGAEADGLRALIEKDQAALAALDDDRYDGLVDKPTWARQRARLCDRITARQREWTRLAPPAGLAGGIDLATVADQWEGRPAWKHAAASVVLEAVLVHAHPAGVADLKQHPQMGWIGALKHSQIRALAEDQGPLQMSLFDEEALAEIADSRYPGERLVACRNPLTAERQAAKRERLVAATLADLNKIGARVEAGRLKAEKAIGLAVGKVIGKHKVAKLITVDIGPGRLVYGRDKAAIAAEAVLDGVYVVRTSLTEDEMARDDVVRSHKRLSNVERDFASVKGDEIEVRPVWHHRADRVVAHLLICMLASYLAWHLRRAWAPLTFQDENPAAAPDPVKPRERSASASAKAHTRRDQDGEPVRPFRGVLEHLALMSRDTLVYATLPDHPINQSPVPTPLQSRAFELIGAPIPTSLAR